MNVETLLQAAETIQEISENLDLLLKAPEEQKERAITALQLTITTSFLVDLAAHLQGGMNTYDALLKSVRVDLRIATEEALLDE